MKYEEQIWPVKLICFACNTQVGAAPRRDSLYDGTLIWCPKCQKIRRVEMIGDGVSKEIRVTR